MLKEIKLHKQSIKTNRVSDINTIKQTSQNENSSIIPSLRQPYANINRPQYSSEYYFYVLDY